MNTKNIIIGAFAVLTMIVITSIAYQSLVVIPREEIEARERKETADRVAALFAEQQRKEDYSQCIQDAYINYTNNWNSQCKTEGKEDGCQLISWRAEDFEASWNRDEDTCVTLYKTK